MWTKVTIICAFATAATAISPGYVSSTYALGSQAEHTIRGYGGLSSFSKEAKAVDSPYATVRKTDIRVTNDAGYAPTGVTYAHSGHAYATPAFTHHGYAAPTISHHGYAAPAITHHGFATPTISHHGYAAPTITHQGYHVPAGTITYTNRGYTGPTTVAHAPIGYHQRQTIAAAPTSTVTKQVTTVPTGGLGVAYSPSTAVAHSTFSGYGVHYGY